MSILAFLGSISLAGCGKTRAQPAVHHLEISDRGAFCARVAGGYFLGEGTRRIEVTVTSPPNARSCTEWDIGHCDVDPTPDSGLDVRSSFSVVPTCGDAGAPIVVRCEGPTRAATPTIRIATDTVLLVPLDGGSTCVDR